MKSFKRLFYDDNGNPSSLRVLLFIVVFYWIGYESVRLYVWVRVALDTSTIPPMSIMDMAGLLGGGGALGAKAWSKKYERLPIPPTGPEGDEP